MLHYADMRPAPFMDKMVSIYRSLDATFSTNMSKLVSTGINFSTFSFVLSVQERRESKLKQGNNKSKENVTTNAK